MGGKYVEGIVDARLGAPVDGDVAEMVMTKAMKMVWPTVT
jgi:hypothetical protein